jgi:hypothetical protein
MSIPAAWPQVLDFAVTVHPSEVNPSYVARISEGKKEDFYRVTPIPSDWGTAYEVQKLAADQEPYHVCLAGAESTCTCPGHTYHGHCRHVEGLTALTDAGLLAPTVTNQAA